MPTSDHFLEAEILKNQRSDPKFSFLFFLQAYFSSQRTITWICIAFFWRASKHQYFFANVQFFLPLVATKRRWCRHSFVILSNNQLSRQSSLKSAQPCSKHTGCKQLVCFHSLFFVIAMIRRICTLRKKSRVLDIPALPHSSKRE